MLHLRDKVALITGSARGIGAAIAERLALRGACVIVNYSRNEAQARETVAAIEQRGAGVFAEFVPAEMREFIRSFHPMRRMGNVEDVADAAEYLASDLAGFVSGQHLVLSRGAPA